MKHYYLLGLCLLTSFAFSQSNMSLSNNNALSVLKANYNPAHYAATVTINDHDQIICDLKDRISADSLKATLLGLSKFHTRHTFSDTVSNSKGIGAARRWVYDRFTSISSRNENRLLTSYLNFDVVNNTCGSLQNTKNVLAILPGADTTEKSIILIQAHMDSRCAGRCDTACVALGMDDNASGTALVIELARTLSKYTFDHTIVFMATTGEEQGLLGGHAMAQFAVDENIAIRAVLNNDIVGGIYCGVTASPPSCSPAGTIDSLRLRIFANPLSYLFPHQSYGRSVQMWYAEKVKTIVKVPMTIDLINQEDRTGRGGDHIPFRERGFRNLRFTSANEHGDASNGPTYTDRQHTSDDILGVDTDGDNVIDSFYVDFNYLARNAVINASSATLLALGPEEPQFTLHDEPAGLRVEITKAPGSAEFRVGVRSTGQISFDELYSFTASSFVIPNQSTGTYYSISVAGIDSAGIMSTFTTEQRAFSQSNTAPANQASLTHKLSCQFISNQEYPEVGQKRMAGIQSISPNPFSGATQIDLSLASVENRESAKLEIVDLNGRLLKVIVLNHHNINERVTYEHIGASGMFICRLLINNQEIDSQKMLVR